MLRNFLLVLMLAIASSVTAIVVQLPYLKSGYHTFRQPVNEAPKVSKPSDALKQAAKEYKEKLNAKKVDIVALANGDTCLLAYNQLGQMAMLNTRGRNLGANFKSPWASNLSLVKVKGDDDNYYYEGIAVIDDLKPQNMPFIKTVDGRDITFNFSGLCAFKINDDAYFQIYDSKNSFFAITPASPSVRLSYELSKFPFYYVSASENNVATDTVNGLPITLPTLPHKAHFASAGGKVYLDGSEGIRSKVSSNFFNFKNTGYYITSSGKFDVRSTPTTGIIDGEEKSGTLVSFTPSTSNDYMEFVLYGPDGGELLSKCNSIEISEPDQMVYYKKRHDDRRLLMGAISLTDTTLKVPPMFANVQRATNAEGNGVWLVARKAFAPLEIYDPDVDYTPTYRNKIEENYNNRKYFDVISALRSPKDSLSYEDILLGLSAYTLDVTDRMPNVEKIVAQYRSGEEPEGMSDRSSTNRINIDLLKYTYDLAKLDEYSTRLVASAPGNEQELALKVAKDAQNTYKMANRLITEDLANARKDYDDMIAQRRLDKAKADALAAERAQEAADREAQLRAERQQAFATAFLNGLSGILQSTMSKSSRSSGRAANVTTGRAATVPSTVSSGGSNKVDNSSRKAFLKGQIIEWKNKAKKAEAAYQQALSGGDDSWKKKNVIDSKRRSVDEALEMVRQYEAELNSLK